MLPDRVRVPRPTTDSASQGNFVIHLAHRAGESTTRSPSPGVFADNRPSTTAKLTCLPMLTRRSVLGVTLLAIVLTSLAPLLSFYPEHFYPGHLYPEDLGVYRLAGSAVLHGRPLYDQRIGTLGFTYPPLAAMLAVPFAAIPFNSASAALATLSLVSLVFFLRRVATDLLSQLRARPTILTLGGLLFLACCAPVRGTFWNGQINLVLAALVVADMQGRRLRGAGIGFAAAIKLTPGIFILFLFLRGRWREAAGACLTAFLTSAVAWVVLPADSARYWLHEVWAASRGQAGVGNAADVSNQSLHGLVLRAVGSGAASNIWLLLAGVALVIGLQTALRLARDGREDFAIGVVGVTGCVISPVSWVHHWVWALPWLIGLVQTARHRAQIAFIAVTGVVVVAWDRLPWGLVPKREPFTFISHNDLVLCAIAAGLVQCGNQLRQVFSKPAGP